MTTDISGPSNALNALHHTARNQDSSPLLRLSGELRNRIFRFAISGHVIVLTSKGQEEPGRFNSQQYIAKVMEDKGEELDVDDYVHCRHLENNFDDNYEDENGERDGQASDLFVLGQVSLQLHERALPYRVDAPCPAPSRPAVPKE
ncbi:hypothetical protein CC86DRAFT_409732 [Ophiobolus disseminans]|uniref:Uncharacterized protein n=1 Tax=Ophiobolus disseminans TaxID=1469910 RepID=A0A6A6ZQ35_9PLEO|nr:hypothetical protein CC86DRAFT_409732 [Ophiobolus disseminans]